MKPRRLLEVTWEDAWSSASGWKPIEEIEKMGPAIARTVGYEMRRTKKFLILAASILEDHGDGEVRIPLGMILKEDELERKQ